MDVGVAHGTFQSTFNTLIGHHLVMVASHLHTNSQLFFFSPSSTRTKRPAHTSFQHNKDGTYAEQQGATLLDGADAAQAANQHDDGSHGDEEIGSRQRRQRGGQSRKVSLGDRQPDADSQNPTSPQLGKRE